MAHIRVITGEARVKSPNILKVEPIPSADEPDVECNKAAENDPNVSACVCVCVA